MRLIVSLNSGFSGLADSFSPKMPQFSKHGFRDDKRKLRQDFNMIMGNDLKRSIKAVENEQKKRN